MNKLTQLEIGNHIKERAANPLVGSVLISWCVVNWKIPVILSGTFRSGYDPVTEIERYLQDTNFWKIAICPLVTGVVMYVLLHLSRLKVIIPMQASLYKHKLAQEKAAEVLAGKDVKAIGIVLEKSQRFVSLIEIAFKESPTISQATAQALDYCHKNSPSEQVRNFSASLNQFHTNFAKALTVFKEAQEANSQIVINKKLST